MWGKAMASSRWRACRIAGAAVVLWGMQGQALAQQVPAPAPTAGSTASAKALRLSIFDAMQMAQRTSEAVGIAQAQVQRAQAVKRQASSGFWPQVTASASYQRTLASEFDDLFENGAPSAGEGAIEELPFGRRNAYRIGGTVTQNLFAGGGTLAQVRQSQANLQHARLELASTRAQAVFDTAQYYYDAVLAKRALEIAQAALDQTTQVLEQTRKLVQEGRKPEFDLVRAEVEAANQRPAVVRQRMNSELAMLRLKQRLDLAASVTVELTTELESDNQQELDQAARSIIQTGPRTQPRTAVRQAQSAVEMQRAAVRVARSQHYPTVNASMSYGRVAYPNDLVPGADEFRTNWTAGLYVSIPIFEGFRISGQVDAAQADLAQARHQLAQVTKLANYSTSEAHLELLAARAAFEATSGTVAQAERAYDIARVRYVEGVSTQVELADARLMLQRARLSRAEAARSVHLARIRVALLPDLPVSTAPSPVQSSVLIPTSVPATETVPSGSGATETVGGASGGP